MWKWQPCKSWCVSFQACFQLLIYLFEPLPLSLPLPACAVEHTAALSPKGPRRRDLPLPRMPPSDQARAASAVLQPFSFQFRNSSRAGRFRKTSTSTDLINTPPLLPLHCSSIGASPHLRDLYHSQLPPLGRLLVPGTQLHRAGSLDSQLARSGRASIISLSSASCCVWSHPRLPLCCPFRTQSRIESTAEWHL